jgi:dGTPase
MKNIFTIAKEIESSDNKSLSPYATPNHAAVRKSIERENRFRPPFAVDRDRILYSGAFRRYTGKTQVVFFASLLDEQLTSRSIHTISVAQVARTIGRFLKLNTDLIEAISLGHDLGHPPFGHDGEKYLSKVSETYHIGQFHHHVQSLRIVDLISKKGEGLNLTFQVRDGILSHDGEVHDQKLIPHAGKKEDDLQNYIHDCEAGKKVTFLPMTLEGCVVRIADTIAYIGQDIEDAIRLGIIRREQIPEECSTILGNNNGQIIESLVKDVVENSYNKNYITMSKNISSALYQLKKFNYSRIYNSKKLKVNHRRIEQGFKLLFQLFLDDIREKNNMSPIYKDYLENKSDQYLQVSSDQIKVRDYLAGMTDRYFVYILQKLIIPDIKLTEET